MTIKYKVDISVPMDISDDWLRWMKEEHVPDVINTGCFFDFSMFKIHKNGQNIKDDEVRFEIAYYSKSEEDFQRYQDVFAEDMKQRHLKRFGVLSTDRNTYHFESMFPF